MLSLWCSYLRMCSSSEIHDDKPINSYILVDREEQKLVHWKSLYCQIQVVCQHLETRHCHDAKFSPALLYLRQRPFCFVWYHCSTFLHWTVQHDRASGGFTEWFFSLNFSSWRFSQWWKTNTTTSLICHESCCYQDRWGDVHSEWKCLFFQSDCSATFTCCLRVFNLQLLV